MQILQALLLFHTQFKIMDIHRNHIRTTFAFYVILLIAPQEFIGVTSANTFTIIALCGRDRLSLPYCMQIDSYSLQLPSISLLTGVPNSIRLFLDAISSSVNLCIHLALKNGNVWPAN